MPRVRGAWGRGAGAGLPGLDEVTWGAKPSAQREGECSGQADLPGPAKERGTHPLPWPRRERTPTENKQDSKFPLELGEETGPPRGGRGRGCRMGLTQAAPGHNGARVARGDTLEHGGLVHSQGEVLRPHEDRRLLVGPRARAWEEDAIFLHFSWDPSHLLTTPTHPRYTA